MKQTSDVWHHVPYIKRRVGFLCRAAINHHSPVIYCRTVRACSDSGFSCSRSIPLFFFDEKPQIVWQRLHFHYRDTITVLTGQLTSKEATAPSHKVKLHSSGLTLWLGAVGAVANVDNHGRSGNESEARL